MPKRRRTAESSEMSDETPVTRSEMWMDDGSIVLQAERTQFKVHRSALARVSTIFSDVFSIPQPPEDDESVDGSPLLYLQDTAQDMQHMLSILYDHKYVTKERIPFQVAASMIRMGSKYEIGFFMEEVIRQLRSDFPITLAGWDKMHNTDEWIAFEEETDTLYDFTEFACSSDIIEVRSILPIAYYVCNTDTIDVIVMGGEKEGPEGVVKKRRPLSAEAQRVCLVGRQRLINRFDLVFSWANHVGLGDCSSPAVCAPVGKNLVGILWRPEPQLTCIIDPWESLQKELTAVYDSDIDFEKDLCYNCYNMARNSHQSSRDITWRLLPSFFDLPDWPVLTAGSST